MNKVIKAVSGISLIAISGWFMTACTTDPDSSGLEYMPDMYRSPSIEPYVDYGEVKGRENATLKMTQSAMTPPMHTIPYYGTDEAEVLMMLPYHRLPSKAFETTHGLHSWEFTKNMEQDYEYNQAALDKNPLVLTAANAEATFAKAKSLYAANCMHCHGEKGDGNGPMVVSGAYSGVPNYGALTIAEGQMFYSIYYGKGMMGSHASTLNKKEIWTLIHHIKKLQSADYGTFNEDGSTKVAVADTSVSK